MRARGRNKEHQGGYVHFFLIVEHGFTGVYMSRLTNVHFKYVYYGSIILQ